MTVPLTDLIVSISEFENESIQQTESYMSSMAGWRVVTERQTVMLAISSEQSCCEYFGYFLTEQDTDKFVGAALLDVRLTDTNRSTRKIAHSYRDASGEGDISLDEGDVMFVDIVTDRGVLQFVAYNAHNGYYGHTALVRSEQLTHEVSL